MQITEEVLSEITAMTRSGIISTHLIRKAGSPAELDSMLAELPKYRTEAWHDLYAEAQKSGLAAMRR